MTFNHLRFKELFPDNEHTGTRASMNFSNNYGISVINGPGTYSGLHTYEVAVLLNDGVCTTTHITSDVLGWQTPKEITAIMKQIQALSNPVRQESNND